MVDLMVGFQEGFRFNDVLVQLAASDTRTGCCFIDATEEANTATLI